MLVVISGDSDGGDDAKANAEVQDEDNDDVDEYVYYRI